MDILPAEIKVQPGETNFEEVRVPVEFPIDS